MSSELQVINGNKKYGSAKVRFSNQKHPPVFMDSTGNSAIPLKLKNMVVNIAELHSIGKKVFNGLIPCSVVNFLYSDCAFMRSSRGRFLSCILCINRDVCGTMFTVFIWILLAFITNGRIHIRSITVDVIIVPHQGKSVHK